MSKISVFIRVKDDMKDEQNPNKTVTIQGNDSILLTRGTYESRKYTQFNGVFKATQEQVYEKVCKTTASDIINGYNVSIMAFGQSNAGKSYTIGLGDCDAKLDINNLKISQYIGLFPRIIANLFKQIHELQISCNIKITYTQIYRDAVYDLLDPEMNKLQGKMMFQPRTIQVGSANDILHIVSDAGKRRVIAPTLMNAASSRSHVILTLLVKTSNNTSARLTVVDLAGSERVNRTNSNGARLAEANSINKSLTALGKCIRALAMIQEQSKTNQKTQNVNNEQHKNQTELQKKHDVFVPYRDSLLTRLLQESLSGNSKTTIIATISPLPCDYDESNSTLQFALRCTRVSMCPTANFALFQQNQNEQQAKNQNIYQQSEQISNDVIRTTGVFRMDDGVGAVECQCPLCGIYIKVYDQIEENHSIEEQEQLQNVKKQQYDANNIQDLKTLILKLQQENNHYKKVTKELLGAYERVQELDTWSQSLKEGYISQLQDEEVSQSIEDDQKQNCIYNNDVQQKQVQQEQIIEDDELHSSLPPLHPTTVERLMNEGEYQSAFLCQLQDDNNFTSNQLSHNHEVNYVQQEGFKQQQCYNSINDIQSPYKNIKQSFTNNYHEIRSKAQEISPSGTGSKGSRTYITRNQIADFKTNTSQFNIGTFENTSEEVSDEIAIPLVLNPPSMSTSSMKPITLNKIKPYQPFYAPKQIKLSGRFPQLKYNSQSKAVIEANQ